MARYVAPPAQRCLRLFLEGPPDRLNTELHTALELPKQSCPPAWFNGNVEVIRPGEWVMFISLNPQLPGREMTMVAAVPACWWKFWLTHNTDHWYGTFFWRPAVLASAMLGLKLPDGQICD
jgi:hypothetical protein